MKLPLLSVYDFREKPPAEEHKQSAEHIKQCQSLRNLPGCGECGLYESCEVIKTHLRLLAGYSGYGTAGQEEDK